MNEYCKTCKNFKDEDADGYGWCEIQQLDAWIDSLDDKKEEAK